MNFNSNVKIKNLFKTIENDKANKILVLNKSQKNRFLIKKSFESDFEIINFEKNKPFKEEFDLILIDEFYYSKYKKRLLELKEKEKPVFLPVILLNNSDKKNKYLNESDYVFDDLFMLPIEQQVMKCRLNNLLKIRRLSLKSEYRYYELAEKSPISIFILNENKFVYVNPTFIKILKEDYKQIINKNLLSYVVEKDKEKISSLLNSKLKKTNRNEEIRIKDKENNIKWLSLNFNQIKFKSGQSILVTAQDITAKKRNQNKINFLNYHDKLTGLYNRNYLEEEMKRLNSQRQLPISIIMGDVNGLKLVNDAFGHQKGNQLLKSISRIFKNACRKEDIIARWGGDEFVILLPKTSLENGRKISERIRNSCAEADINPIKLSIALGVAQKSNINQTYKDVLKEAEDRMYRNKIAGSESARNSVIKSLEKTLLEKSHETKEHSERLNSLAVKFAKKLSLSPSDLDTLKLLGKLHDIGKVSIPEKILKKKDTLTAKEYKIIKGHPESGYRIVKSIPELAPVAEDVLSHHERWDGDGYPQGLSGKKIPYITRILTIIDSYDVMTHQRAYKSAMSKDEALLEIKNCAGGQFDPDLAEKFIEMMN